MPRPLRGAPAALRQPDGGRGRPQARRDGQHRRGPSRCRTTCAISWAGSNLDAEICGDGASGSSTTSTQQRRYFRSRLEDLLPAGRRARAAADWRGGRWRSCRRSIRPASPPATCASACCCNCRRACRTTRSCKTLIQDHLEDLAHNRLPVIERKTGLFDRADPGGLERAAEAQSQAGRRLRRRRRADGHARRVRRARRRRHSIASSGGRPHAAAVHQPVLSPAAWPTARRRRKTREYIKRKINSAQWLIESIEQRRSTLTRVAQAIVDHQTASSSTRAPSPSSR